MFMAAKDYFAYFFIGPYIAIFRNIRSDLGLVSARVLVGGSAGGDSHCFYNQYILRTGKDRVFFLGDDAAPFDHEFRDRLFFELGNAP